MRDDILQIILEQRIAVIADILDETLDAAAGYEALIGDRIDAGVFDRIDMTKKI